MSCRTATSAEMAPIEPEIFALRLLVPETSIDFLLAAGMSDEMQALVCNLETCKGQVLSDDSGSANLQRPAHVTMISGAWHALEPCLDIILAKLHEATTRKRSRYHAAVLVLEGTADLHAARSRTYPNTASVRVGSSTYKVLDRKVGDGLPTSVERPVHIRGNSRCVIATVTQLCLSMHNETCPTEDILRDGAASSKDVFRPDGVHEGNGTPQEILGLAEEHASYCLRPSDTSPEIGEGGCAVKSSGPKRVPCSWDNLQDMWIQGVANALDLARGINEFVELHFAPSSTSTSRRCCVTLGLARA